MKKYMHCTLAYILVLALSLCILTGCSAPSNAPEKTEDSPAVSSKVDEPIKITFSYSDNPTYPFREDWPVISEIEKRTNSDLSFEVIPMADYATKVSLMLNTGKNVPDVILCQSTKGENGSLALNGALVPISDYSDWTPNFNKFVEENNMQSDLDALRLKDGKFYCLPSLYDTPFYDAGLIMRNDYLVEKGFEAPKTFDDLYEILKAYKEDYPDSYPLTILVGPRVLHRMVMPSFGISLGKNSASSSYVLSYDYDKQTYFPGAISEEYKEYISMMAKWYAEGLVDPEMAEPIDGDRWAQKLATGASMATYAYYDQMGGIEGSSDIEGLDLEMYPPLLGPGGAHHQPKSRTGNGILFPAATAKRADFEQLVRTVDEMFFNPDNATLWCLGIEGVTYTVEDGQVKYMDDLVNSTDGLYKTLQTKFGCGTEITQLLWINEREMTKYDENYAQLNKEVAAMDTAIQSPPPAPKFDDLDAETAGLLQAPLGDAFDKWCNDFFTGQKSVEEDWDEYVQQMKTLQIEELCKLYNDNM